MRGQDVSPSFTRVAGNGCKSWLSNVRLLRLTLIFTLFLNDIEHNVTLGWHLRRTYRMVVASFAFSVI